MACSLLYSYEMLRLVLAALFALGLAMPTSAQAGRGVKPAKAAKTAKQFAKTARAAKGKQRFFLGHKVPKFVGKLLGKRARTRELIHVDNASLSKFVAATKKGYLEVVIPANTGHVWFRQGEKLYDFGPKGFRVSGVRDITKERYGVLVKLDAKQEADLGHYLHRLEVTKGKELGDYDFKGDKGFQCVTWIMRHSFGEGNFVKMLGGSKKDATSMPRFSEFMVKRAKNVDAVIVYNAEAQSSKSLNAKKFDIMSLKNLRKAFAASGRPDHTPK